MFKKILIANRGEIACRIMRTCRRMGIETVAVYSQADADALHARMADEAVPIGPAASAESYLKIDAILDAARATGAQAVHPGFGFLAENAEFARALEAAGIVFIGPPAEAIAAMGDKIESKKLALAAGVNTVPGHVGTIENAERAVAIAREIGFPVMVKAAAGGGGKGMRVAANEAELREGFRRARSEARSSFGDERVFLEKFVEQPRHIEIQVLADGHGRVIHLGERECSIQRRHQKVVEEAPSPFLDAATRRAMGEQAVALARAVGYRSAGTVEFIVDAERNFYFLEMNTRLQVEHPVTEAVTGLDLVEQMIRVAAGERLAFDQDAVTFDGWAVECRVYAEDPYRGFLPSIGRLKRYQEPPPAPGLRIDSGISEGAEISMFYDPMIAKVCAHGTDRDEAIARMRAALDAFYIRGVNHNVDFLNAVVGHPRFRAGRLSTHFIAEEFPDGFHGAALPEDRLRALAAVATVIHSREGLRAAQISGQMPGWAYRPPEEWVVRLGLAEYATTVRPITDGGHEVVVVEGRALEVRGDWTPGEVLFRGSVAGQAMTVQVERRREGHRLVHGGAQLDAVVRTRRAAELAARMPEKPEPDLSRYLLSPMPGLVVSVAVRPGDEVRAGEELAVIEAMKMENVIRAERDARVAKVHVAPRGSVAADQILIEFE
jgi:propionyl-CoA carboxylase alpha chain